MVPLHDSKLVALIACSIKWQSLLIAGDGWQGVYGKKLQRYAKDNETAFNCMQW